MTESSQDLALPTALAEVAEIGFDWEPDEDRGCDFELYEHLEEPEKTAWWFRLWTANKDVDGSQFRFFGTTGDGSYAGFWLTRPGVPITEQPVVFLGSEGERGVVARDLGDLLWLFAADLGPYEALEEPSCRTRPNEALTAIARRHAPDRNRSPREITAAAAAEFPGFSDYIDDMCR